MKRLFRIEILGFVFHFALATIGVGFVCFVAGFFAFVLAEKTGLSLGNGGTIFGTAYNPWFWIPAGLSGYFVNRVTRNRSACVVGSVALLLLFALMSRDVSFHQQTPYFSQLINDQYHGHYWRYEFEQLLSPSDAKCGSSECLGKLLFTLPVVTSIAYSIGAWLGLRSRRSELSPVSET